MRKHWIALGALVLLGAGCTATTTPEITEDEVAEIEALIEEFVEETSEMGEEMNGETEISEVQADVEVSFEEDEPVEEIVEEEVEEASMHGSYGDYSEGAVAEAVVRGDKVVLFFHAVWCPFCKQLDNDLSASQAEIPVGVTVLKTDFDSQGALKNQYGVRFQHTFVQIDANGDMVTSWLGGGLPELELNLK
jgi:thiol-disulfide isomerase/thioredoxin